MPAVPEDSDIMPGTTKSTPALAAQLLANQHNFDAVAEARSKERARWQAEEAQRHRANRRRLAVGIVRRAVEAGTRGAARRWEESGRWRPGIMTDNRRPERPPIGPQSVAAAAAGVGGRRGGGGGGGGGNAGGESGQGDVRSVRGGAGSSSSSRSGGSSRGRSADRAAGGGGGAAGGGTLATVQIGLGENADGDSHWAGDDHGASGARGRGRKKKMGATPNDGTFGSSSRFAQTLHQRKGGQGQASEGKQQTSWRKRGRQQQRQVQQQQRPAVTYAQQQWPARQLRRRPAPPAQDANNNGGGRTQAVAQAAAWRVEPLGPTSPGAEMLEAGGDAFLKARAVTSPSADAAAAAAAAAAADAGKATAPSEVVAAGAVEDPQAAPAAEEAAAVRPDAPATGTSTAADNNDAAGLDADAATVRFPSGTRTASPNRPTAGKVKVSPVQDRGGGSGGSSGGSRDDGSGNTGWKGRGTRPRPVIILSPERQRTPSPTMWTPKETPKSTRSAAGPTMMMSGGGISTVNLALCP